VKVRRNKVSKNMLKEEEESPKLKEEEKKELKLINNRNS